VLAEKNASEGQKKMTNKTNCQINDGLWDEQKCTQKIGILPGPTKKWRI